MLGWSLTDYFGPAHTNDTEDPVAMPVVSVSQLRRVLKQLGDLPPRVVYLTGGDRMLRVGIGGPFGGFAIQGEDLANYRLALARTVTATEAVDFTYWCQPCQLRPEHLFVTHELIELLVGYIETGAFPEWLGWDTC